MDISNLIDTGQIPAGSPAVVVNLQESGTIFGGVVAHFPHEIPILITFGGGSPMLSACDTTFHSEIVAIKTFDGTPSLEGLSTTGRNVLCTLVEIVIMVDGSRELQVWQLDAGTANSNDPGQLQPADYDEMNPKYWEKVG